MESRRKSSINSPSSDRHKSMHFKSSPSALAWKDTYRQKCIERLRTGREKLVNKFRNINVELNNAGREEDMDMARWGASWLVGGNVQDSLGLLTFSIVKNLIKENNWYFIGSLTLEKWCGPVCHQFEICFSIAFSSSSNENQNLRDLMREEWNLLMKGRPGTGWGGWDFDEEELLKMMDEVEADLVVSRRTFIWYSVEWRLVYLAYLVKFHGKILGQREEEAQGEEE